MFELQQKTFHYTVGEKITEAVSWNYLPWPLSFHFLFLLLFHRTFSGAGIIAILQKCAQSRLILL